MVEVYDIFDSVEEGLFGEYYTLLKQYAWYETRRIYKERHSIPIDENESPPIKIGIDYGD